jgi:hypothetical protein
MITSVRAARRRFLLASFRLLHEPSLLSARIRRARTSSIASLSFVGRVEGLLAPGNRLSLTPCGKGRQRAAMPFATPLSHLTADQSASRTLEAAGVKFTDGRLAQIKH